MPAGNRLRILSLSYGVDSWTLAAMSVLGEIPPFDYAFHIDTGYERASTMAFARQWGPWLNDRGLHVITIATPDNRITTHNNHVTIPAHSVAPDGSTSILPRHCNRNWKVYPSRRLFRSLMNRHRLKLRPATIHQTLGIAADEPTRVRTSPVKYIQHHYPLVDLNITRAGAIDWLRSNNLPVPTRSACYMCPLTPLADWTARRASPDWPKAVHIDNTIRNLHHRRGYKLYLHRNFQPLEDLTFDAPKGDT